MSNPISQNTRNILAILALNASKKTPETNATKVSLDSGVAYAEVISTLRVLEEQGYGKLIVGRKGAATRFAWTYAPNGEHAAALAKVSPSGEFSVVMPPQELKPNKVAFDFGGRVFSVELPNAPTKEEMTRLSSMLLALVAS